MIHGLDTGFLVAAEVREHGAHANARVRRAAVRFRDPIFLFEPAFLEHVVEDFTIAKSALSHEHIKNIKYAVFFESSVQQDWSRISEVAPALASVLDGLLRAHCVIEQFKETRSP